MPASWGAAPIFFLWCGGHALGFCSSFEMARLASWALLRTHMAHSGKEAALIYGSYN